MNEYYYDLHIHSCLSPCADDDMTPNNICGMAALNGLNIIALTDHNTCGNCESFLKVAKANGKEFDATTSASDFCDILKEVFTSESFVFHGITGAPAADRTDGKSNISWDKNGCVEKEPLEYVAKN